MNTVKWLHKNCSISMWSNAASAGQWVGSRSSGYTSNDTVAYFSALLVEPVGECGLTCAQVDLAIHTAQFDPKPSASAVSCLRI